MVALPRIGHVRVIYSIQAWKYRVFVAKENKIDVDNMFSYRMELIYYKKK